MNNDGEMSELKDTIAFYDQELAINPNNYELWTKKGNLLDELSLYKEAIA